MIEELLELLRGIADNPGRAIAPLWTLFWLWSVARSWIKRLQGARAEEVEAAPPPEPPPAPPPPKPKPAPPREAVRPAPPRPAQAPWPALIERAETLRAAFLLERSLRGLEPILVSEVIDPLHAVSARGRATDAATQVERRAAGAVLTLQALEQVARERNTPGEAASLFELDRIAQAAQRPLSEYARAEDLTLLGHTPLAVHFEAQPQHYARGLSSQLLFLPVASGAGAALDDYTKALQALGRRWFSAFPTLGEELRDALGLSDRTRLVDPRHGFDERSAFAAFGPWLPALFAEVALSLRLGNAYVTALRHQVVASGAAATRARAQGEYLSSEPPPLVRMHAALFALEALGRRDEAKRHRAALDEALPDATQISIPLADGRFIALPAAFMLGLTEQLSQAVLEAPLDALGAVPLGEWPGLSQTLEEAREQITLSRELMQGSARNADAAQLLSAAWLAVEQHEEPAVLARLRSALSPRTEPAKHRAAAAPTVPGEHRPRSLHAALHDPRTLRNAVLIGAAFSPPRSTRSRQQRG
jgi:hypothetical protein